MDAETQIIYWSKPQTMKWKTIMIIKLRQMNFVFGIPKQGNLISIKYDEKLQIAEK